MKKLVLSAMFLALGLVLPFFTGQIPKLAPCFLPMHIPVLLCGMIVGGPWGAADRFYVRCWRSALFSMPPPYPTAVSMAFELAAYGLISGLFSASAAQQRSRRHLSLSDCRHAVGPRGLGHHTLDYDGFRYTVQHRAVFCRRLHQRRSRHCAPTDPNPHHSGQCCRKRS